MSIPGDHAKGALIGARTGPPKSAWWQSRALHAQILLTAGVVAGGGGVGYGAANAAIQILALALLALHWQAVFHFVRSAPRSLVILCALTLFLPLAQLVPLPVYLWQPLPGRELVTQSLELLGDPSTFWMPFSLDPARTLVAFLGTLAPFTMIVLMWDAPHSLRLLLLRTAVVLGLASALLGLMQAGTGNGFLTVYDVSDGGNVVRGMFANRNSAAVFLDAVLVLACGLPLYQWSLSRLSIRTGVLALFVLGVIGTMSRSGTALLLVPLAFLAMHLWAARGAWLAALRKSPGGIRAASIIAAALLVVVVAGVSFGGGRLALTFDRFDNLKDQRAEIWSDALGTAHRYWPLGAGTGTFDEVFQVDESLEYVTPRRAGRAHNDFLELAIETGIVGEALAAGWLVMLAIAAWCARGRPDRWEIWASATALMCFVFQSGIDYPLRNQSDLCLAGLLVALAFTSLVRKPSPIRPGPDERSSGGREGANS